MILKFFIKTLVIIASILLSVSYFLSVYHKLGFSFANKCMLGWAFCLVSYAVIIYLFKLFYEDFDQ